MQIKLIQHIRKHINFSEHEVAILNKYVEILHVRKKALIHKEDYVCNHLYFVEKGCVRMFFVNKKGIEQITQFALDGWWITDYQSFVNNTSSVYFIQAIEETNLVSIEKQHFENLLAELPRLEMYFRRMLQKEIAGSQHRSRLLYDMSKEEFYVHFSTSFPEFMQRVPQYMIASYLGLTPEYLSELRKKKA